MDTFSQRARSEIMRRVGSKDTQPELTVRSVLHKLGFRFRVHRQDLPGTPDIVLSKHRTVVFVHGCFWHRHKRCKRATTPSTRLEYWAPKFERTILRDKCNTRKLKKLGWRVIIVWECETLDHAKLARLLLREFSR